MRVQNGLYFIDDDSNIEEKCRLHRYDTLCKNCRPDEAILTAHHFDDQIETFMLRILRGSSLKGLSSMKKITTMNNRTLIRPFLDIPRDEIKNYQDMQPKILSQDLSFYLVYLAQ